LLHQLQHLHQLLTLPLLLLLQAPHLLPHQPLLQLLTPRSNS
jgi:hypothetical protein